MRLSRLYFVAVLLLSACAGDADSAGGGGGVDGGAGTNDGGVIGCTLLIVPPTQSAVGQPVEVSVNVNGTAFGAREFFWSVDIDGATQNITELSDPADRIAFTPLTPGPYRIVVDATVGGAGCLPATELVSVMASGARAAEYRMRVVPSSGAPMQDFPVTIYGGSDAVLPTSVLASGTVATGQVSDSTGAPVAAYLRARLRDGIAAADYETFSSATGDFALQLPDGRYDLLVVPSDGALPSAYLADRSVAELAGPLMLPAPTTLSGQLLDSSGVGVAGARVSLVIDGARSTEATSASDGSFSVLGPQGTLSGMSVAPPVGSGMPSLRSDGLLGQAVDNLSTIRIRYADASISAQVDLSDSVGAQAATALVEWRADIPAAGSVEVASVESVPGTLRVLAIADASGRVQSPLVARTSTLVAYASDGDEAAIAANVPWATAPLSSLSLQPRVALSVRATSAEVGIEGAQVQATPVGVLAPESALVTGVTNVDGANSLGLVAGGSYEILVSDVETGEVVQVISNVQGSSVIPPFALPGTIVAQGHLLIGGDDAAGAQVRLYCDDCNGPDKARVQATAVADVAGRFSFRIADPGVDAL